MDHMRKIEIAIRTQLESMYGITLVNGDNELARAALAAMLGAVGEPVAYLVASPTGKVRELYYNPNHLDADEQAAGWTETPLYSLAALREEGL